MRQCVSLEITNLQTAHWGVSDFKYKPTLRWRATRAVGKTPISHAMMQSVCRREERKGKRKGSSPIIKTLPFAVSFHFHSSIFFLFFSVVGDVFMRLLSSSYENTFVNNHTL